MVLIDVDGLSVDFPYEPYGCQRDYVKSVIRCLHMGWNGALESPTGTGKTLCLLTASLAWLQQRKAQLCAEHFKTASMGAAEVGINNAISKGFLNVPKIYYAARTHNQLSQVVRELNKTSYKGDQLCINDEVQAETHMAVKNHLCRAKVNKRSCMWHNNWDKNQEYLKQELDCGKALDIEDFLSIGKRRKFCPFYASRNNLEIADLVLLPYNYILDPKTRRSNKIELKGNIIIFDEAHNLEKMCEDSVSVCLKSRELSAAIREAKGALKALEGEEENFRKQMDLTTAAFGQATKDEEPQHNIEMPQLIHLIKLMQDLEHNVDEALEKQLSDKSSAKNVVPHSTDGRYFPGGFLTDLLKNSGIVVSMREDITKLIDRVCTYLTSKHSAAEGIWLNRGVAMQAFGGFLETVFPGEVGEEKMMEKLAENSNRLFTVYLCKDVPTGKRKPPDLYTVAQGSEGLGKEGFNLNYWCWNAGVGMQMLAARGVKSVIVTSGTLSPLKAFTQEMGIPFAVSLENPHVVSLDQIWMGVLNKGPDEVPLNGSYINRRNAAYIRSMGNALINIFRQVPQGVLVFFASYAQMTSFFDCWKEGKIWERMEALKALFVEPRNQGEFHAVMRNFDAAIKSTNLNGAALFAICRGKVQKECQYDF